MTRTRGFLLGLGGGAVGAALVILVLVLVFNFGEIKETVVEKTSQVPATYAPSGGTTTGGYTPEQIYQNLSGGVVAIQSDFGGGGIDIFGQPQSSQALGTGFVVDQQGYILTNAHVVQDQGQSAASVTVVFNKGGGKTQQVKGTIVGIDTSGDVAVIKVDPTGVNLQPLPLGDSSRVVVGEPVVAIGNPLGYDFSITSGIVSAVGRSLQAPNGQTIPNGIQTDAAINPGNSGGPLIDSSGKVIGINEQIATNTGGNQGLGFAVPINSAIISMDMLKPGGPYLGVGGQTLTPEVAKAAGLSIQSGALVEQVKSGTPAAKAGIKAGTKTVTVGGQQYTIGGDVIVKVDSTDIAGFDDLVAYLATKKPGDTVTLTLVGTSGTRTVQAPPSPTFRDSAATFFDRRPRAGIYLTSRDATAPWGPGAAAGRLETRCRCPLDLSMRAFAPCCPWCRASPRCSGRGARSCCTTSPASHTPSWPSRTAP
jgi:S1-C subfamily serine protease